MPLTAFNPKLIVSRPDPYPLYREFRERDPVHWSAEMGGIVCLFSRSEVETALTDPRFEQFRFPSIEHPLFKMFNTWLIYRNKPDHTWARAVLNRSLTPEVVASTKTTARAAALSLIEAVRDQGTMDLVKEFASPLPLMVLAELLGVPQDDRPLLRKWTLEIVAALEFTPTEEDYQTATRACLELMNYLSDVISERHLHPRSNDLMSNLIAETKTEVRFNEQELLNLCALLLCAGNETTISLISNGTHALLQHPDQYTKLCQHPELTKQAVEECLRYDPPVQLVFRRTTEALMLGSQSLEKGQLVCAILASANRDASVFPDPEIFDIERKPGKHTSFSLGPHYCAGAAIGRHEAHVAFETLAKHLPNLKLVENQFIRSSQATFRGFDALHVTF